MGIAASQLIRLAFGLKTTVYLMSQLELDRAFMKCTEIDYKLQIVNEVLPLPNYC
jgi:hypothetical protein